VPLPAAGDMEKCNIKFCLNPFFLIYRATSLSQTLPAIRSGTLL